MDLVVAKMMYINRESAQDVDGELEGNKLVEGLVEEAVVDTKTMWKGSVRCAVQRTTCSSMTKDEIVLDCISKTSEF